jgi:hypothetical protein
MRTISRNDDPPDDEEYAELQVSGEWFAWDENGKVYHYQKDGKAERDDGYNLIGELHPLDVPEYSWQSHLREFAQNYLNQKQTKGE